MTRRLARLFALVGLALLCSAGPGAAQSLVRPHPPFPLPFPRIKVPEAEKPITIGSLDTRVSIHGLTAETTQTLTFFNPNGRPLEGELEFPLPDGATVAGFGLDVDGQLVDGVVVPKEQARVILETEVRRGVDPGLVEQVRGNLYRARVYPLPARGTRTVRLRWVSQLTTRGAEAAYHLPLPYDAPVAQVSLRIEVVRQGTAPEVTGGFGNLTLQQGEDRWVAEASWRDAVPARDLLVKLPGLPAQVVAVEPGAGDESFFSVSDLLPAGSAAERPQPRRLALAWDASGSRLPEATERELRVLQRLLAAWPQTAVDLVVFRDQPEPKVSFAAGERDRLFAALRAAPVDGGTALAGLDLRRAALPDPQDVLWLLASDGLATLGEALPPHGDVPVWPLTGSSVADRGLLRHLATSTGGELLDLLALDPAAAVAAVARPGVRLLRVHGKGPVEDLQIQPQADRSRAFVTGRLLGAEGQLTLVYGVNGDATERRTVQLLAKASARAGDGAGPVATSWAQGRIEQLSIFADKNAEELLGLGRRFGLATAATSLLVLETLEQHLRYGVEPAASRTQLLAQYRAAIGERQKQAAQEEKSQLERVVDLWRARADWWKRDFRVPKGFRWEEAKEARGGAGFQASAPRAREEQFVSDSARASAPAPVASAAPPPPTQAMPKKAKGDAPGTEASIAIRAWDPQAPYLVPLREAPKGHAYAAYLGEREKSQGPAFFLDCAEFFLRQGDQPIGLRVLSNLAELRLDDPALLRVLAWRLAQAGELDLSAVVLDKVLRLRPEEPQSKRDLALVLADRAEAQGRLSDAQRAIDLLYAVVLRPWDRFPEIELIALMELNRILVRAERRGLSGLHTERIDPRLVQLLDVDLRISLSWDADNTDVDLHVFEPDGEHAFYAHNRTAAGGLVSHDLTQGYGPEEYLVHRALPGKYAIKVHYYGSHQQTLVGPATLTATVFTNWGRPDEKRQVLTLRLANPRDMEDVGVVTIGDGKASAEEPPSSSPGRTLARFRALRRGMLLDQVTAAVGQPDSVAGTGATELRYRLEDGTELRVRIEGAQGVQSVVQLSGGAELELLP